MFDFFDEWDAEHDVACIPQEQVERIEEATADLAVATFGGFATNDRGDYEGVFEDQYIDRYFSRIGDLNRLQEMDIEIGVRLIGADPYLASLVVCTYGFGRGVDATTGEGLSPGVADSREVGTLVSTDRRNDGEGLPRGSEAQGCGAVPAR